MSSDAFNAVPSRKLNRVRFLARNSGRRQLKSEIEFHQKRLRKDSKAFSQRVLLYLAENSQKRHQRETRISKLTQMFNVCLDEAEPRMIAYPSKKKTNETQERSGVKIEPRKAASIHEEIERQKLQRGSSVVSEASNPSLGEDNQCPDSSQRARALSMGILEEVSEAEKRRLSAPEVVVTPVAKQTVTSFSTESSKEEDGKNVSPPRLTPQNSVSEVEDTPITPASVSPSSGSSPLRLPREKTGSFSSRGHSKSTFKTYSRTPFLLKRIGSHDSSASRKKISKQEQPIPYEEIPNPLQDQRFLDLLLNLHILPGYEESIIDPNPTPKPQTKKK